MPINAYEKIKSVRQQAREALKQIHHMNLLPDGRRVHLPHIPLRRVEQLVGKSRTSILKAEKAGVINSRQKDPKTSRRSHFTIDDVVKLQEHFGTRPCREKTDVLVRIAVQNFKGGVGKSTQACSLAQFLAEKGYRVLLVDLDPQGSTTATFGLLPDTDIKQDDTLFPYFVGVFSNDRPCEDIKYAIRSTHWTGLDLIPSNLLFGHSEYALANLLGKKDQKPLDLLRHGFESVDLDYDVVIFDSPPALNFLAINVLKAANAYVIPVPAGLYDFMSTYQFLEMLEAMYETTHFDRKEDLLFLKFIATRIEANEVHSTILSIIRSCFPDDLLTSVVPSSQYVREASSLMTTIYEMPCLPVVTDDDSIKRPKPVTSMKGYRTARQAMDEINVEIEKLIVSQWESRINRLIREAH